MIKFSLSLFLVSVASAAAAGDGDWFSNWSGEERILTSVGQTDSQDSRSVFRGSGKITIGNGIAKFNGSPRLYIMQEEGIEGWEQVEITGYGKYVSLGEEPLKSSAGLTLATRSNHDQYKDDPCEAFSYYARIYRSTGQCSFQKEYYHSTTTGTVYTPTKRVTCFPDGLPLDKWVGMKFKVTTIEGTGDVKLELWLDENDNGNWVLKHSMIDEPGTWFSSSTTTVPDCPQKDGDTVLRPGKVSMIRADGQSSAEVHWRDVTMTNSLMDKANQPTKSPTKVCVPSGEICPANRKDCCTTRCKRGRCQ